ncbi:MAG: hypothetical protein GC184_12080 [Rhizobiales bacterium]|nr:hypothetical protein [Hyphomicrobiales bacterium]
MPDDKKLDRATATSFLASKGFNQLDIECILDLTAPYRAAKTEFWPAERIERLAARAYWLGESELPQKRKSAS